MRNTFADWHRLLFLVVVSISYGFEAIEGVIFLAIVALLFLCRCRLEKGLKPLPGYWLLKPKSFYATL